MKQPSATCATPELAQSALPPHITTSCGQSRSGGFTTSNSRRRSSFLGRVAVAYVQGSPKGGGALGLLRVVNTRLRPVPPDQMGVQMRIAGPLAENHKDSSTKCRSVANALRAAAAFVAFLGANLWCEEAHASSAYDACMAKSSTSFDFSQCGSASVAREEAALAVAWRQTYKQLSSPEAKARLLQEQRLWIKYKDASCGFFGTDEFGSMGWSEKLPECRIRVIRARIDQLSTYRAFPQ